MTGIRISVLPDAVGIGPGPVVEGGVTKKISAAGVPDGDKSDITVSDDGATWAIDANAVTTGKIADAAVTLAKQANLAEGSFIARNSSGTGVPEAVPTAQVQVRIHAPRVQSVSSSATVTPTFADDMVKITAQAAALDLANPTGTAVEGHGIVIRIKDNGTARAITYGTQYRAIGVTLPTTTVISKTLYLAMVFNATDTKWDVLAAGQEA